jgi:hypothetical protein
MRPSKFNALCRGIRSSSFHPLACSCIIDSPQVSFSLQCKTCGDKVVLDRKFWNSHLEICTERLHEPKNSSKLRRKREFKTLQDLHESLKPNKHQKLHTRSEGRFLRKYSSSSSSHSTISCNPTLEAFIPNSFLKKSVNLWQYLPVCAMHAQQYTNGILREGPKLYLLFHLECRKDCTF